MTVVPKEHQHSLYVIAQRVLTKLGFYVAQQEIHPGWLTYECVIREPTRCNRQTVRT